MRAATAKLTIRALYSKLLQNFGVPETIVSDNGSQFTSHDFHRFCRGNGIRHVTTSPYYPQPSHCERFNRNLKSALIAFHAQKQDRWDENLQWLQLAFNTASHESHKAVPFEVLLGYPPNNPLSNLWSIKDLLPPPGTTNTRDTWEAARRNLLRARERVRRRYNEGRIPNPFKAGDYVYCKAFPTSRAVEKKAAKLGHRWTGPHRILRMLTPVTVELAAVGGDRVFRKAHVSHLKKYHGQNQ